MNIIWSYLSEVLATSHGTKALNGWLLFGLTTAFLFAMIQKVRALGGKEESY